MRVFGECAIVNTSSHVNFRKKINNKGEKAMFIGYSTSHPEGTYKFIKYNNQKLFYLEILNGWTLQEV